MSVGHDDDCRHDGIDDGEEPHLLLLLLLLLLLVLPYLVVSILKAEVLSIAEGLLCFLRGADIKTTHDCCCLLLLL